MDLNQNAYTFVAPLQIDPTQSKWMPLSPTQSFPPPALAPSTSSQGGTRLRPFNHQSTSLGARQATFVNLSSLQGLSVGTTNVACPIGNTGLKRKNVNTHKLMADVIEQTRHKLVTILQVFSNSTKDLETLKIDM